MILGKKVIVVMPAYNAEKTLEMTYKEIPHDIVDEIILTDDKSDDKTLAEADRLGIGHILKHDFNQGYGANQKTCYKKAIELGADIIIMLHPDYQYTPKLIHSMAYLIAFDVYPVVLGSRILGGGAKAGGMPLLKYYANRIITFIQNVLTGAKLSEFHTGYRAFSADVIRNIPFEQNANGFIFDNQILLQILYKRIPVAEITCPTKYFEHSSSISYRDSIVYGIKCIWLSIVFFLSKTGIFHARLFH